MLLCDILGCLSDNWGGATPSSSFGFGVSGMVLIEYEVQHPERKLDSSHEYTVTLAPIVPTKVIRRLATKGRLFWFQLSRINIVTG